MNITEIQSALIHDPDYRRAWVANIAMAIYDTKRGDESIHEWRQRYAEQFIKYLCAGHPDDPTTQFMEKIGH